MVAKIPSTHLASLPTAYFAEIDKEIAAVRQTNTGVIDVSKGNPDIPTPQYIVSAMQAAVADPGNHGYPAYRPHPNLAGAVAYRYREDYGVRLDPGSQVAIFNGAHEPLVAIPSTFLDPDDVLVIPDPYYPAYPDVALLAGRKYITLPLTAERNFQPDFESVPADVWSKAGVLLLNYPHNPTGALARRSTFERALEIAERYDLLVVNDFAYAALGYDGQRPLSILEVDTDCSRSIEIQTMSKTYSMAGWRFGYVVGNTLAIAALNLYREHGFATVNSALQIASATALTADQHPTAEIRAEYEHRRNVLVSGLTNAGFTVAPAEGSFFVWVRVDGSSADFATRALRSAGVAVAPGAGFGNNGEGWIRIALVHDADILAEVVSRLSKLKETES